MAFLTGGRALLTGSADATVRVWDLTSSGSNKTTQPLAINSSPIANGPGSKISPDAQHLLARCSNDTFSVWETRTLIQGQKHRLPWTNTIVWALATGGKLAAFANRSQWCVWDLSADRELYSGPGQSINELCFSADARQLAVGGTAVFILDVGSWTEMHRWTNESITMNLHFSRDGRRLAAGLYDGLVKVWDLSNPPRERRFRGHVDQVNGLAFSPDGCTFVSSGDEICIWDVKSQQQVSQLRPRPIRFTTCAISPDGRTLAVADFTGLITLWSMADAASPQQTGTLHGHKEHLSDSGGLVFSPDGSMLVSVSQEQFRVWRAAAFAETDSKDAR
jgi:WD40 repeat protein